MKRSKILKALAVTAALPLLYLADTAPDASTGLTLIRDAQAIVGAPATPVSVAGVARRTTRRVVAATTATTSARAQQKAATAQQQQATAQQQAASAQQQAAAARPAGAPAIGTVVSSLPAGCKPETQSGVEVQNCGGAYDRSAFQGTNLVYVVQ
jgi:phosphopantothenoylcysteine synthetase/decarboxylase